LRSASAVLTPLAAEARCPADATASRSWSTATASVIEAIYFSGMLVRLGKCAHAQT
jgi:hypothetical protein